MSYQRVAVLRGGNSTEYALSLESGKDVVRVLDDKKYTVKDVVISRQGDWLHHGFAKDPQHLLSDVDVVFLALHGESVEDGQLIRLLDRLGLPYTGSGAYATATAFNKTLTKQLLKDANVLTPPFVRLQHDAIADISRTANSIAELFGPQYVVKPNRSGSSNGINFADSPSELADALLKSFIVCDEVIVEQYIEGKNATVALVEDYRNEQHYTFPAIETMLPSSIPIVTAELKNDASTDVVCPGNFSKVEKSIMKDVATNVHKVLNLSQYSRSDFIVAKDGVYFLEVNSRPALTKHSSINVALEGVGSGQGEFFEKLLQTAKCTR